MKKVNWVLVSLLAMIFGTWFIISVLQPPMWVGHSADKSWTTTYEVEHSLKETWKGMVFWNGEHEVIITEVELSRNGNAIHGWEKNEHISSKGEYMYLSLGEAENNREDELRLTIHWRDESGNYEEQIELSPKTRYLIVPRLN
ncbi:hypothetical protein PQ478_04565 [Alkalihalophilus pseudofirmus]|uniref:hypothetical protein n=1 Tax=Alkalihalophilus pseudofirmus TaxID=79885 RepID=UPI00259B56EB|nr:hypothetical protein [Alkalihalophilus pseudofirmus]WEG17767.1 hypothetical protein PQ478_04565 [Alkalihalophilus pseudofirmus]